ncbi:hypothetical protein IFR04_015673 [Cadophora malorum]|uniref:Uncharacterized protein n=1 Tax=Cadophora malorum TaxID=108018 RepID=A0A8H7T2L6_9HELO|nr:hypothetical protein IFR04_015673 [Cadophora malorum]
MLDPHLENCAHHAGYLGNEFQRNNGDMEDPAIGRDAQNEFNLGCFAAIKGINDDNMMQNANLGFCAQIAATFDNPFDFNENMAQGASAGNSVDNAITSNDINSFVNKNDRALIFPATSLLPWSILQ